MNRAIGPRRATGLVLLGLAAVAPLTRVARVQSIDWTPAEIPLAGHATLSREFRIERSGTYELGVRIDRPADRVRRTAAECALGFDFVECADTAPMRIRWALAASDGSAVACGRSPAGTHIVDVRSSGGRFTPSSIDRTLGCFDADEGVRYALDVEVLHAPEALGGLRARLVVRSSAVLDREAYSTTAAVWLVSGLVGLLGAIVVLSHPRAGARVT